MSFEVNPCHGSLCWFNSKHNRVGAWGDLLDWNSTEVVIQRTLHLTCIKQLSLSQSTHHATSRSNYQNIGKSIPLLGTIKERPFNYTKYINNKELSMHVSALILSHLI